MDEYGLRESYNSPDGIAVHGDTMYIAGTRLDRVSGLRDVLADFTPDEESLLAERIAAAADAIALAFDSGVAAAMDRFNRSE